MHLGQDVFVPLVLAGLFCFLLSPVVNLLERWRIWRVPAVLITTTLAFTLVGALAYVAAEQALDLAYKLPSYQRKYSHQDCQSPSLARRAVGENQTTLVSCVAS